MVSGRSTEEERMERASGLVTEGDGVGGEERDGEDENGTGARYLENVGFRDEESNINAVSRRYLMELGGGQIRQSSHREASDSVSSVRYDYVDPRNRWVPRIPRHHPHNPPPVTHTTTRPESDAALEDYVQMKSAMSHNFTPLTADSRLSREEILEEEKWGKKVNEVAELAEDIVLEEQGNFEDEHPVPSQPTTRAGAYPDVGQKGLRVPPTISGVMATANATGNLGDTSIYSKKYVNINVSSFGSLNPPFHVSKSGSKPDPPPKPLLASIIPDHTEVPLHTVEEEAEDNIRKRYKNTYVNIDGSDLPLEQPATSIKTH